MDNEYYGVASTPMDDYLAHYGIRGMKWGVRKALKSGNDRALRRQRIKAEKKLAKLEKLGANGKKFAKRAAAYGAGAAVAGAAAGLGTDKIGAGIKTVGTALGKYGRTPGKGNALKRASTAVSVGMNKAGNALIGFGNKRIGGKITPEEAKYFASRAQHYGRLASDSSLSIADRARNNSVSQLM